MGICWPRFVVAVDLNDAFIGCGQVKQHKDDLIELASIAVVPVWRQHGVASAIIQRLLATHTRPIFLTCREQLGSFYSKFGFYSIQSAEMPPYFRRISRIAFVLGRLGFIPVRLLVMRLD